MSDNYQVIFSGKLSPEKSASEIKKQVIRALKLSAAAADRIFDENQKSIVLKKTTSFEQANNISKKFEQLGLIVSIKEPAKIDTIQLVDNEVPVQVREPASVPARQEIIDGESGNENTWLEKFQQYKAMFAPIIILILSICMSIIYSPLSDGMLRPGFILGVILLLLGLNSIRTRLS